MTRAPSAIFVVRHGARLDAANSEWHLTSPAPYDPPLTYGGWNQAKALGSRIASIISQRAAQSNAQKSASQQNGNGASGGANPRMRKQKVVIHSSPFLRCLQTSVAVGAGMAQSLEIPEKRRRRSLAGKDKEGVVPPSHDTEEYSVKAMGMDTPDQINVKTMLRVDAFLGEWLSPDYFESITPPPNSTMMVAAGKAHLLRKEQLEVYESRSPAMGNFPGGWSKPSIVKSPPVEEDAVVEDSTPLDRFALMAPLRQQRSNSANSPTGSHGEVRPIFSQVQLSKAAYTPPLPAYAIKPTDPIPRGYCVHARDSCTDIDLLWDSMRYPQNWGDCGELGEEWSSMHKRFRRGLSKMVEWYKHHTPEFHPDREDPMAFDDELDDDDDDGDYDLTVIMITHAAGCNALVGALTNQPVLHDFGLTSLSLAIRKPDADHKPATANGYSTSPLTRRRSSVYMGLSEDYDMEIVSSTEHLRAGVQATRASALHSPHLVAKIPTYSSLPHTGLVLPKEPKRGNAMSAALGSIRRPSLTPAAPTQAEALSPRSFSSGPSNGLWSRTSTVSSAEAQEPPALSIGSPAHTRPSSSHSPRPSSPAEQAAKKEDDAVPPLPTAVPSRSQSQRNSGLWGAPTKRSAQTHKRRWTLTEQDDFD